MLPLRISVEGFMSYRDRTTFDFEGARLWMLAGDNGAGKSTVFDALRWALFGVHRAGKQKPEQLIHHEAMKLLVEVELELGEEIYRLKRTLGREGARPTWDVARRVGNAWESVAGTSMANEYNRWIESHIGLTDEAFCASVYLSQGRADAILNADADARYELLSQLVDLEIYEHWHERADERRSNARAQMVEARRRWELAPSPAPEVVVELREREMGLKRERGEIETRIRELDGARTEASRWEEWSAQLELLDTQADRVRVVLGDEEAIEQGFARLGVLRSQGEVVERLWGAWSRHLALEKQLAEMRPQLESAQGELSAAQERNAEAQSAVETAQIAANGASEAWSLAISQAAELTPQRAIIEQRSKLLGQHAERSTRLAAFENDAEARLETAQSERDRAREAARVFPLWQRFGKARQAFVLAGEQQGEWTKRHAQALEQQGTCRSELAEARWLLETSNVEMGFAREEVAKVGERERALNVRRADFARVEGDTRCHFCGQELSPEHRAAELERLETEAQVIAQEKANALQILSATQERFETARQAEAVANAAVNEANNAVMEAEREIRHQSDNAVREHAAARAVWEELGQENGALDLGDLSGVASPDAADLEEMEKAAKTVVKLEKEVTRWQNRVQERSLVAAEVARLDAELRPLLEQWTDRRVEEWLAHAGRIERRREEAQNLKESRQSEAELARKQANEAGQSERLVQAKVAELTQKIGPLEGQEVAAREALHTAKVAFDAEPVSTFEELSALRDNWSDEKRALERSKIEERHAALLSARGQLADIERHRTFYADQIASLPPLAQRPRTQVEAEWQEAKTRQGQLNTEHEEVNDTLRRLEREEKERGTLEVQLQEKTAEHKNWEELAHLLGPHQLQRHLLREAERAIVREANGILETISGGTLRLELVTEGDETSGNRKPKVLDVMCYHLTGSEEPQPILPAFLSGSQRFRVAVALALGIGRTAARGSGNGRAARVETILIDEGFGALDKTGRDEMKDELRELGRELGRVILVSHQEDFARAFPNRFNISLENGVSRVQKVVE